MTKRFGTPLTTQYEQYSNPSYNSSTQSLSPFELLDIKERRIQAKKKKLQLFFMIIVTIVVATIIIATFLCIVMKIMINTAKQETNEQGSKLGSHLTQWVNNATDWLKKALPPKKTGVVFRPATDPSAPSNDSSPGNGSITLFGEGKGLSLNGLINVVGEVIKAVNNTPELRKEREQMFGAGVTTQGTEPKPGTIYHLSWTAIKNLWNCLTVDWKFVRDTWDGASSLLRFNMREKQRITKRRDTQRNLRERDKSMISAAFEWRDT